MTSHVITGDCLTVMAAMPAASVDAIVTDPPYGLGFMGKEWDDLPPGLAWAVECLRVLKPGGHLLAFGGTRTYHRLACAIEDAGFEIRDCLAWMYGSGFPKSLDVGKAIDKRPGVAQHGEFATHLRERIAAAGYTNTFDVAERVVGRRTGAVANWQKYQFPEAKWWPALRDLLDMDGARWDAVVAEAERAKMGERAANLLAVAPGQGEDRSATTLDVTAPATPDAEQWNGWGTALKPSHEPVVWATKPPSLLDVLAEIGSRLNTLETWLAQAADSTIRTGEADASPAQTAMSLSGSETTTFSSTVTSWRNCWDELWTAANTSTTSTATKPTTDLKTLSSCLSEITPASTTPDLTQTDGWRSLVTAADSLFAGAVLSLRATRALFAAESATGRTPTNSPGEGAPPLSPAHEPIVLARKPLTGTVAANVLTHGTGGLNIDATRIQGPRGDGNWKGKGAADPGFMGGWASVATDENASGRWPANVLLDPEAAALLDAQSGEQRSGVAVRKNGISDAGSFGVGGGGGGLRNRGPEDDVGYGDSGGASRFFYIAKASSAERNAGLDGFEARWAPTMGNGIGVKPHDEDIAEPKRNVHPTVKPIDLMRWLTRLTTPPGGTVLDPFTGSGTTGIACHLEGFQFTGIEREPEYAEIARARLAWWAQRDTGQTDAILQALQDRDTDQLDLFSAPPG